MFLRKHNVFGRFRFFFFLWHNFLFLWIRIWFFAPHVIFLWHTLWMKKQSASTREVENKIIMFVALADHASGEEVPLSHGGPWWSS